MFTLLGQFVTRRWMAIAVAWVALLAVMLVAAPKIQADRDDTSFLPADAPSRAASDAIQAAFDKPPALSAAAIVVERPTGLTGLTGTQPDRGGEPTDWRYLTDLTRDISTLASEHDWGVLSPADPARPFLRGSLVSRDGQAAVIRIDLPSGFVSQAAVQAVARIHERMERLPPPSGLNVAITGSASYGRDYFQATETSLARTTWVTVIAVLVILLLTYRALLAAAVSLVTVTVAVIVSISILAIGSRHGWSVSMIVELFTIVIGYGAGVDFSLFFLSRYREELGRFAGPLDRESNRQAIVRALAGTGPAILASAGTVAAGLVLMWFARFRVFRTAGPAVSVSVAVSCLASLTLTPVLAYLLGRRTFWPRGVAASATHARPGPDIGVWDRLAGLVVRRSRWILFAGLLVLLPVAALGFHQKVVYDTLADLPCDVDSVRGAMIFRRHFAAGDMAPARLMVQADRPISQADWVAAAAEVDAAVLADHSAQDVRSATHPLGRGSAVTFTAQLLNPADDTLLTSALRSRLRKEFTAEVAPHYLGRGGQSAYWEIALADPPYSNEALNAIASLRRTVEAALHGVPALRDAHLTTHLAGDTAQMRDLRAVTNRDFWVVGLLVIAAIVLIVTWLVRDLPLAVFVMLATVLTYGAALAATGGLFHWFFGTAGPDWKVEFFLFVILVAVGQDYNLFMLTRIAEERARLPLADATRAAVSRTGAIVSCCGLIMAATLGSLASSPLRLLQELGVAFVIGLLLDTFVVRPLMVPAFVLLARRMDRPRD